jgi:ribonuclease P protein component
MIMEGEVWDQVFSRFHWKFDKVTPLIYNLSFAFLSFVEDFSKQRTYHETHIPAEQPEAEKNAWFFGTNELTFGSKGIEQTTGKRKTSAHSLMPGKRDESFSRENRLRKSTDFKRVFNKGKRIRTPYFVLYVSANGLENPRLGIQVKARIGTAIRRNYIKRIVREVFRRIKKDLREPIDLIFIADKRLLELSYGQFRSEFENALHRLL